MIKSIHLKNLQSHKDSLLEFHPGVNVIVGTTDSGKSAILRGFRLVALNKPSGDGFRSHWGGDTEVEVQTEENIVTRLKTNSKNLYIVNGEKLAAFGREKVPEEVERALNLSNTNLQRQSDGAFLISETAGAVAAHFNSIVNLEVIGETTKKIQKLVTSAKTAIETKIEDRKTKLKELEGFEYLEKAEIQLEVLEEIEKEKTRTGREISILSKLIKNVQAKDIAIAELEKTTTHAPKIDFLLDLIERRDVISKSVRDITRSVNAVHQYEEDLKTLESQLLLESKINALNDIRKKKDKAKLELENIEKSIEKLRKNEKKQARKTVELDEAVKELEENMPDICPFCETDLTK